MFWLAGADPGVQAAEEEAAEVAPGGDEAAEEALGAGFDQDLVDGRGRSRGWGLEAFRGSGPSDEQGAAMLSAWVAEYDIADVRPLFGEGTA